MSLSASGRPLVDRDARVAALSQLDRTLLVEAGAGSGKTAIMAGRVAMLLIDGVEAKRIAAVTFTEAAAGELLGRVRRFVDRLLAGDVPRELADVLPQGLDAEQRARLQHSSQGIDDITCSTIHGFCQRLIKPYPVEADLDPGASVMDPGQAGMLLQETIDGFLRERLAGEEGGLLSELVWADTKPALALVRTVVGMLQAWRELRPPQVAEDDDPVRRFTDAVEAFDDYLRRCPAVEADSVEMAKALLEVLESVRLEPGDADPAPLVRALLAEPDSVLVTQSGSFRKYKKKTKWGTAAQRAGLTKAAGDEFFYRAEALFDNCGEAWGAVRGAVAARVLAGLMEELAPVPERFRAQKRQAALLDFDDLLHAARDLLRDHEPVRRALAERYAHVLVDEFQDTDPLQAEIFWRLCGEELDGHGEAGTAAASGPDIAWTRRRIRAGALFLVGDPKQAIYRFRGADVRTYLQARDALLDQDPGCLLSISSNFRSRASILSYVNERFAEPLSREGQPGFTALASVHNDRPGLPPVSALPFGALETGDEGPRPSQRHLEAEAVAEFCARLIGEHLVTDPETGEERPCQPGDIALLAPTGTELHLYEAALERRGIPVATQAGKGFYQRQEVQDLLALTRVLADGRDSLALGALLRGPLVGLSEAELLDLVWGLPRDGLPEGRLPRLSLWMASEAIAHPLAREVMEKLQALRRRANATTPHDLLSQAIDVLRVRPILLQRYQRRAERALANVDLFVDSARPYAVRGMRAFADAMTTTWEDEARAVEGRADAQEASVALYTMHAAKGLEWPVVVPVNTGGGIRAMTREFVERDSRTLYCPVFGVAPAGFEAAVEDEEFQLSLERVRLWYVAATRAREALVLPYPVARDDERTTWRDLVDLALHGLPEADASTYSDVVDLNAQHTPNAQTRERFAEEATFIAEHQRSLRWLSPSRDEGGQGAVLQPLADDVLFVEEDEAEVPIPAVQGGRERGLLLHKLFEEVLTGETDGSPEVLAARAEALIRELGLEPQQDASVGPSAAELAGCVARTLELPEIAALRDSLVVELPVYASEVVEDGMEDVTVGVADAVAYGSDGSPLVVLDWKSDVNPAPETVEHYRAQVGAYLQAVGITRGLIVFATRGLVVPVAA